MTTDNNLSELEALKNDYNALAERIKTQEIISDRMIQQASKKAIDKVTVWYRRRALVLPICAILVGVFVYLGFDWKYITLVGFYGMFEFALDKMCLKKLGLPDLMEQDMTTAASRILAHKKARRISEALMAIPFTVMLIWTLKISTGGEWTPSVIILTIAIILLALNRAIRIAKLTANELDEFVKARGLNS